MKCKNKFEEDDFQEINYNEGLFSKTAKKNIKGKGKSLKRKKAYLSCIGNLNCVCKYCINKDDMFEFTKIFNYIHSENLFNYSFILTEYKKHSKILNYKNFKNFFFYEYQFDYKLIYRASENNYSINSLIKNKNHESKNKNKYASWVVIKMINNLYFVLFKIEDEYKYGYKYGIRDDFACFFTFDEIKYNNYTYGIKSKYINDGASIKFEIGYKFIYFSDYFTKMFFADNIQFKKFDIKEKSDMQILDLEYFDINIKNSEFI